MNSILSQFLYQIAVTQSFSERIAQWSVSVIATLGGPGAALLIAVENLFPPLPSEVILPLAGFTASRGELGLLAVIIWTTLGSLVGALALYALGASLGRDRLRAIVIMMPLIKVSDFDKTEKWFQKHETQTVFWGRMIPIFRSLISIPAGVERMPLAQFALYTTAGSLIWNSVLIIAGYLLGEQWEKVGAYVSILQYIVIAVVIAASVWFIYSRLKMKSQKKAELE